MALPNLPFGPTPPTIPSAPSLNDALSSIKDGSGFANASKSLGDISSMASNLPPAAQLSLATAQSAVSAQMNAALANLSRDISISAASVDLQNTLSGTSGISAASADAALGPLAVLKKGPEMLKAQTASIASSISGLASTFGASLPSGTDAIAAAKTAGAAAASFFSSIPPEMIDDPLNPGTQITNPAYTAFVAANPTKMSGLTSLTNNMSSAASSLTSSMDALVAEGQAALASSIGDLKAMSLASKLANPLPTNITGALGNVVDITKIDGDAINKAMAAAKPLVVASLASLKK